MKEVRLIALGSEVYEITDEKARGVKTIAEMKSLDNLLVGNIIRTFGYHQINDGGSGCYLIREKLDSDIEDNGSIHFINDELVAELIVLNNEVNIKQFGAKGDGLTDSTINIQNAFNYCQTNQYEVLIPVGTFMVSELNGYSGMRLKGINKYKSILKSISNNTCTTGMLKFLEGAIVRPHISKLTLEGNKWNNTNKFDGLYFFTAEKQTDSYVNIENMEIQNFTGNGLTFDGTASTYCIREARVNDVRSSSNNENGFYINSGTDNMFSQNTACFNVKNGFFFKGANQKVVCCKAHTNGIGDETTVDLTRTPASAFTITGDSSYNSYKDYFVRSGSGYDDDPYVFSKFTGSSFEEGITYYERTKDYYKRYSGFEILSSNSTFVGCESQDNYGDGMFIQGINISVNGFIGDNNGFLTVKGEGSGGNKQSYESASLEQIYDGIHVYGCNSINIDGIFNNFRKNELGEHQRSGLCIEKSSLVNAKIISRNQISEYKILDSAITVSVFSNGIEHTENYDISRITPTNTNYEIYTTNTNESTIKRIGNKVFLHLCLDNQIEGILASDSDIEVMLLPEIFRPKMHHCYNGILSNNHGYSIAGNGTINVYKNGKICVRGNSEVTAKSIILDCVYEV